MFISYHGLQLTSGDISVTGDLAIEEISADATHEVCNLLVVFRLKQAKIYQ